MSRNTPIIIYTDGACHGNPGTGGWAAVLIYKSKRKELSGSFRLTTNNRMELTAVINALEVIKNPEKYEIILHSDSMLLINGINKNWLKKWVKSGWKKSPKSNKIDVKNPDLWQRIYELTRNMNIKFVWVEGHAGVQENERCDILANEAINKDDLPDDSGYSVKS